MLNTSVSYPCTIANKLSDGGNIASSNADINGFR